MSKRNGGAGTCRVATQLSASRGYWRGGLALCMLLMVACAAAPPRTAPLPEALADQATVLGLEDLRHWSDAEPSDIDDFASMSEEELRARFGGIIGKEHHYLALSGGGENGAFTAGLLAGWTAAGDRPDFTLVTGISTGALIAPFAFLGPAYDQAIKEVYTGYAMEDLVDKRAVRNIVRNDALADSTPLQGVLKKYVTDEMVVKLAAEADKGRMLLIATTHLDAGRSVMWDLGAIAASGKPGAAALIRQLMLASASIPVGMPPVLIEVEADGQPYNEMHVDGGVTEQVFLYPADLHWSRIMARLDLPGPPQVYVVRNGYLDPAWQTMKRKIMPIAGRTINSLIRTQSIGDIYRLYVTSQRDGLDFHFTFIPESFAEDDQRSGIGYMKQLYQFAYESAKSGYPWQLAPPGFEDVQTNLSR